MQAILRQIAVKQEQIFLGLLYNAVNAGREITPDLMDICFAGAEHAIKRLYPLPEEKPAETEE